MFDLVTIVFRDEIPFLKIQAESINQYFNSQDINEIAIIINDTDDVADLVDPAWWKQHQSKVKIKCRSQWNYEPKVNGWESQQLLKLFGAADASSTWSMVLDAKTWFIKTVEHDKLFTPDNRAKSGLVKGLSEHFATGRKFVEDYFNISMPWVIGPSGVPFMFHTESAIELINSIDNFVEFFETNVRYPIFITEFNLYSGFIISKYKDIENLYGNPTYYTAVNISDSEAGEFEEKFAIMSQQPRIFTASIHRKAYAKLTQDQQLTWIKFLKDRNIIEDITETQNLINTYIK
ncbi:hypothetical protein UFOVP112_437 [uncultured Caudovirales phage]|uniref:Uncharacterized protein n=1 Tax=uncultured Caudovirales phage TaxID=2100421 RepID=A0A6J5LCB7_9CAUD|nr:hypothetical protein UFOVP112_437 [uncultured Caudovirales phage]